MYHTLAYEEIDNQKEDNISNNHVIYQKPSKKKAFLQIIAVFASNGENCVRTAALLDSGSDAILLSNRLQFSGITKEIALTNVLSMKNKFPLQLFNFSISWCSHPCRHGLFTNLNFQNLRKMFHLQTKVLSISMTSYLTLYQVKTMSSFSEQITQLFICIMKTDQEVTLKQLHYTQT